jgi:hypothetical protein
MHWKWSRHLRLVTVFQEMQLIQSSEVICHLKMTQISSVLETVTVSIIRADVVSSALKCNYKYSLGSSVLAQKWTSRGSWAEAGFQSLTPQSVILSFHGDSVLMLFLLLGICTMCEWALLLTFWRNMHFNHKHGGKYTPLKCQQHSSLLQGASTQEQDQHHHINIVKSH